MKTSNDLNLANNKAAAVVIFSDGRDLNDTKEEVELLIRIMFLKNINVLAVTALDLYV